MLQNGKKSRHARRVQSIRIRKQEKLVKLGGRRGVKGRQDRNDDAALRLCDTDGGGRQAGQNQTDHRGVRARHGSKKEEISKSKVDQSGISRHY